MCGGWGLAVERLTGLGFPAPWSRWSGFAAIVVAAQVLTLWDSTAGLVTPIAWRCAVAGLALSGAGGGASSPGQSRSRAGVFAVYAAPIVLSGQATFAGYIKLDDTATWMALTDRIMEHGRSLSGPRAVDLRGDPRLQPRRRATRSAGSCRSASRAS